jgi:hypothetical protein
MQYFSTFAHTFFTGVLKQEMDAEGVVFNAGIFFLIQK